MEKLTAGIREMVISEATYHEEKINPTCINYFFGNNGAGKTTIAREIAKLKIPVNETSCGEEPQGVIFEPGKTQRDFNFLVFDRDFINANFRQLDSLPGVFMIDEGSIRQEDELMAKKKEKDDADREYGILFRRVEYADKKIEDLGKALEEECWILTKDLRKRFSKCLVRGTRVKKGFLKQVKEIRRPSGQNQEALESLYDTVFDENAGIYNLLQKADPDVMESVKGLELLGKRIVSSSDTDFAQFIKALNATDWVRQGHEQYHDTSEHKCPYCQQTLPESFERDIEQCFDERYQREVAALSELLQAYRNAGNSLWKILQSNLRGIFPKLDTTEYRNRLMLLKNAIAANIQLINQKIKEPASEISLDPAAPYINEINKVIDGLNTKIRENNDIVKAAKAKKQECMNKVWNLMAFRVSDTLAKYMAAVSEARSAYNDAAALAKKKLARSAALADRIAELNRYTVNTEEAAANMNRMLKDSGFQGFFIREHPDSKNQYQIIREDGTVAEKLSEGERNFIAFLYFCNLVRGNGSAGDAQVIRNAEGEEEIISDGRDVRDKIVVIDDPASGMDQSSLFTVSSLVRGMIALCKNTVRMDEKKEQDDRIRQMFILTHNTYFHREVTAGQEKDYERVSFFLITKNDNKSGVRHCVVKDRSAPAGKRNYNPVQNSYTALWAEYSELKNSVALRNVIRRILGYYFIRICGYDGCTLQDVILKQNRHRFVVKDPVTDEETDTSELQAVTSLVRYITAPDFGINENLHFIEDSIAPEVYKDIMRRIFEAMGQLQHYEMMSSMSASR